MSDKDRIEELERRVRDLEARPMPFPIYIPYPVSPAPVYPYVPSWPAYPSPLLPIGPTWVCGQATSGMIGFNQGATYNG